MIELKNVWKIYIKGKSEIVALKNVSLTIYENDYISITGPSGSGKTTLINIIGTIDNPTKGEVYYNGNLISNLRDDDLSKLRREKIGFVFQSFNLIPNITVWENISLPLYYAGIKDKKERKKRSFEVLEKVNLLDRANHYPFELSGGEEQRVAIARALINNPQIVLADEPTGNLDTKNSENIISLFESILKQENFSLIIVTHNLRIAERAKRKFQIIDGELYNKN